MLRSLQQRFKSPTSLSVPASPALPYNILLLAALLFCNQVSATNGKTRFSGKLMNTSKAQVMHIKNIDGIDMTVAVDAHHNFSLVTDSLEKGFYSVGGIGTVYLCKGYQLKVQPVGGHYYFTGSGALENNALRTIKKRLPEFIASDSAGTLKQEAYYYEVPVFLAKLDSFQQAGELLFKASADTFFSEYASLDLTFYGKKLLMVYSARYGYDLEKLDQVMHTIDTMNNKAHDYMMKMISLQNSARLKQMSATAKANLAHKIYMDWDKNNEILFRNSSDYRDGFEEFFYRMSINNKYITPYNQKYAYVNSSIKTLTIARGEISNPYIRSYFEYTITASIIQQANDTAIMNKYYHAYLAGSPRKDHLQEITELYNNALAYTDNTPAPSFRFRNASGKNVTLESLRGRFVYIDVWATWCGPCKTEIPHLKELETAYRNRNLEFVSISVDDQEDAGKWKAFVQQNNLQGTQLMSDNAFKSAFIRKMNIHSIPRFILISPEGTLISANALRPSDAALREQLDKLLQ